MFPNTDLTLLLTVSGPQEDYESAAVIGIKTSQTDKTTAEFIFTDILSFFFFPQRQTDRAFCFASRVVTQGCWQEGSLIMAHG